MTFHIIKHCWVWNTDNIGNEHIEIVNLYILFKEGEIKATNDEMMNVSWYILLVRDIRVTTSSYAHSLLHKQHCQTNV